MQTSFRHSSTRVGLGTLLTALVIGCSAPATQNEPTSTDVMTVSVQTLQRVTTADLRIASGTVEPWQRVSPGTKIMGRVSEVGVELGERVVRGTLLAKLDDADLRAAVQQARAAISIAKAQLTSAEGQFRRMAELVDRGSATTRSLEEATSTFEVAKASLQRAHADLAAAEATLLYAEIRAPIDGFIVAKHIEAGDIARPGQPFFTLENVARVKVTAQVAETDIVGLAAGSPARVAIPALNLNEPATIARVNPAAEITTRTFDVEAHLDNDTGAIRSGMFARISFALGDRQTLLLPTASIVKRGQLEGVFVVDGGRARLRWLRLGRVSNGSIEVLSGIEEGEVFVESVPPSLTDGMFVETSS